MNIKKGGLILPLFFSLSVFLLLSTVFASDVAYVVRNANMVDEDFLAHFEDMDLNVTIIEDKAIASTNFAGYDFIFVGSGLIRNIERLPTTKPVIVTNGKYAQVLGFLERGSVRQISTNQPLQLRDNNRIFYAYTTSSPRRGAAGLSYVYLPNKFRKTSLSTIATTSTRRNQEIGDAVAYVIVDNSRRCFFGINNPAYWTGDSEMLFHNCVNFVMGAGSIPEPPQPPTPPAPGTMMHSVMLDTTLSNTVNGLRIRDEETQTYLLDQVTDLHCDKKYKIDFRTKNTGNFTENVNFMGSLSDFSWKATKTNLAPGQTTTTGSKTITVNFIPGVYVLNVNTNITGNIMTSNNRTVRVVC